MRRLEGCLRTEPEAGDRAEGPWMVRQRFVRVIEATRYDQGAGLGRVAVRARQTSEAPAAAAGRTGLLVGDADGSPGNRLGVWTE